MQTLNAYEVEAVPAAVLPRPASMKVGGVESEIGMLVVAADDDTATAFARTDWRGFKMDDVVQVEGRKGTARVCLPMPAGLVLAPGDGFTLSAGDVLTLA